MLLLLIVHCTSQYTGKLEKTGNIKRGSGPTPQVFDFKLIESRVSGSS